MDRTSTTYGIIIKAEKTKVMTNTTRGIMQIIRIICQSLEEVHPFKYLGAILTDEGTTQEILARTAQTTEALK